MNNKGQFSIIAALLVAVVLIAAVMTTYSAIRYSPVQAQPQILSAVDETNQAIKQLLGFTVGYYGSVLRVTGNVTYAQQLASNYLTHSLPNVGSIKPDWGLSMNTSAPALKVNWFMNDSYSQGNMSVTYDLNGLGITGISYSASSRLEVQVTNASSPTQAQFKVLTDNGEPLINLGPDNIKFYKYAYGNLTWDFSVPTNIVSHGDGTYTVDLPQGVSNNSYVVQVEDTRGLSVLASSFSQFTSTIAWNSSAFQTGSDYVDTANLNVLGTHSNFNAQQQGPDSTYDTLTEQAYGLASINYYPLICNLAGSTTIAQSSGNITADTCANDSSYLQLHSYPSAFSAQTATLGYSTKGTQTQTIEGRITGALYTTTTGGQIQSISAAVSSSANNRNVKVAIYLASDNSLVANSNAQIIGNGFNGWLTFTFTDPKPVLSANTNYILVAWADTGSGNVYLFYDGGSTNQGYSDSRTFGNWSNPDNNLNPDSNRKYSVNCTYTTATQYTVQAEFTGSSDLINWQQLTWAVDSSVTAGTSSCIFQLYNYGGTNRYPTVGEDGYISTSLGASDNGQTQTITQNPTNFRNSTNYWKLKVTVFNTTAAQFDLKLDLAQFTSQFTNYALNLQEQCLNVNASNLRQDLCIKTGSFSGEPLVVQVYHGGSWQYLTTLAPNYFNNASLAAYIDSPTLTIRFVGSNDATDPTSDSWNIDSVYLQDEPDISYLLNLQQSTFTLELLQNGTMRWLGQNIQTTTQTLPIPPIPVKAIHVNETINGINQQVPFQIEDWASNYQIPLGLTSNSTVFGNRQMIVFLLNGRVTDFTVWWDGSDVATQTPMAFTNRYFVNDNSNASTLTNGNVTLLFGNFNVKATVTGSGNSSTATFMRINQQASTYGAGAAYVIQNGIVRDIVEQEAEWNNGPTGSPNLYANIILTLPANATYYTYQLRIMFINSTQTRSITDLCPIQLTTTLPSVQTQTENGTFAGFPTLQNGTAAFFNSTISGWTPHHFSQFISGSGKGAGIMFTDNDNQRLYALDSIAGQPTGSLNVTANSPLIELLPVDLRQVQFAYAYDITWQGAVVTFDGTTSLCSLYDGTTPMGLWILAEYPPTLTVTAKS